MELDSLSISLNGIGFSSESMAASGFDSVSNPQLLSEIPIITGFTPRSFGGGLKHHKPSRQNNWDQQRCIKVKAKFKSDDNWSHDNVDEQRIENDIARIQVRAQLQAVQKTFAIVVEAQFCSRTTKPQWK